MRTFRIITAAAFLAASIAGVQAQAASAPPPVIAPTPYAVKANPFITASASGWYLGVNSIAGVAASSVSGTNILGLSATNFTADGAALGGDFGYIWGKCFLSSWCQVEAGADWQNISGGSGSGSVQSTWSVYGEFDIGVQALQTLIANAPWLNQLNTAFPTLANPSSLLPAAVRVATTPQQYLGVKIEAYQLSGTFGGATGETVAGAYGLDSGWRWQTLGTNGQPNGGSLNMQGFVLWPGKGVTLSDVFGSGGRPMISNANAAQSTIFGAKLQYDLGIGAL
jgi:hypothetical protein